MSSVGNSNLANQIARKTAIFILESPARDKAFGTPEAWEYIETYLCGEHDLQACVCYLKGYAQALARLSWNLLEWDHWN